ncbi:hypothetical protein [Bergeriella denitrificans]|uniref:Uncharacterized protein n=1 Tax=Bergeriella denitrificans TaxID=494 RepID=A0A378UHU2_BERDE|nr:hypothetical protein [Bergeriella denitrificans]STZ76042.1 Uncharacterised protein [Bergeriella denitrificans]
MKDSFRLIFRRPFCLLLREKRIIGWEEQLDWMCFARRKRQMMDMKYKEMGSVRQTIKNSRIKRLLPK